MMLLEDLQKEKVLVIGGQGFFGQHLVKLLRDNKITTMAPSSEDFNLLKQKHVEDLFEHACHSGVKYVFHLAGYNGGIKFNMEYPMDIFYKNTLINLNVVKYAAQHEIKKLVSVVTSCAYPEYEYINCGFGIGDCKAMTEIMKEEDFLNGTINETVACHGYAKRNLQLASMYAKKQYGLNAVCICPTTLYGPGDSFDVKRTKVVGGLIHKFIKAKQEKKPYVECWGTGKPMRELIYVTDAARYALLSLLKYNDSSLPLNIGSGQEISIKKLAELIAKTVEYNGEIRWDTSKVDGQYRKRLDRARQISLLGELPLVNLEDGIKRTIDWCFEEKII